MGSDEGGSRLAMVTGFWLGKGVVSLRVVGGVVFSGEEGKTLRSRK